MTTLDSRYLEAFPGWLKSLAEDAQKLAGLLEHADSSPAAQRGAASALNYLFKSLDLIPDGLEDLGLLDDAFVMRALAETVKQEATYALPFDESGTVARLAEEAELVREFLGDQYARLEKYASGLER